jgi:AP-1 complex subunit gamma-1
MFIFMTIVELCHTDAAESKPVHAVPEAIDLLGSLSSTTSVSAETKPTHLVSQDMDLLDGLSSSTSVSG